MVFSIRSKRRVAISIILKDAAMIGAFQYFSSSQWCQVGASTHKLNQSMNLNFIIDQEMLTFSKWKIQLENYSEFFK